MIPFLHKLSSLLHVCLYLQEVEEFGIDLHETRNLDRKGQVLFPLCIEYLPLTLTTLEIKIIEN